MNRWSFNNAAGNATAGTTMTDSVSGAVATVWGNGSTFTGTALRLTGSTTCNTAAATISGYVELPNGIISSKTNLTVEVWAKPISAKNWMRVFDFGRTTATTGTGTGTVAGEISGVSGTPAPGATSASDNLMLSFFQGTTVASQRLETLLNGGNTVTENTTLATTLGTEYQYVVTFEDSVGVYGTGGGQLSWYRNGVLVATGAVPFHLASIEDVNNWIGRSQWGGDNNTNADYNEFRIYNHAFTAAEAAASYANGPTSYVAYVAPGPVAPALPVNRWSFNNTAAAAASGATFTDGIGGSVATLRGIGATLSGTTLVLPGTTTGSKTAATISAYVDLPNGMFSSKPNFSVEFWATPLSSQSNQRLFDIGRTTVTYGTGAAAGEIIDGAAAQTFSGYDNLVLSLEVGTSFGTNRLEGQRTATSATPLIADTDLSAATVAGTEYHYVLTVENNAGTSGTAGCLAKWYRNGVLQNLLNLNFHFTQISDVNNWIGRSQYSADNNSNVAINEFRIYSKTLSPEEIALSRSLGADASIGTPAPQPDSVTIHAGQKALINVLANDTGSINPATVEIVTAPTVGTATVDSAGRILYTHSGTGTSSVTFTYRVLGSGGYTAPQTVTIQISNSLRISNSTLNVPSTPPATAVQVVDAYPGATFTKPLCFVSPPGDTKRLFVCELGGKLKVIPDVTASTFTPSAVLDMATVVSTPARNPVETLKPGNADPECGLLGLAFHPNYANNGYLYVLYTVGKASDAAANVFYQRLSRFTVSAAQRALAAPVADPASEYILLEQRDREDNHNGGDLHFGPDGYLYCAFGDEGNPNDNWGNSQRIDVNFFSAMLRIDVDKKPGNLEPNAHPNPTAAPANTAVPAYSSVNAIIRDAGIARYSIPIDNPFVPVSQGGTWNGTFNGVAISAANLPYVRSEFWAVGLRSPWRFSFDSATGDLWLGDVGQDTYEEVDIVTKGGNYGWIYREAAHNTAFTTPTPPTKPAGFTSIDPVWEYVHNGISTTDDSNYTGNSIIGGVVYRGTRFASLTGAYICGDNVSGNIWAITRPGGVVTVQRIAGQAALTTFGTDPSNGDVLVSDYNGGRVMRIITTTPDSSFPTTLSATGLFADLTDLSPAPGLLPYSPNLTFWSDYAIKRRWFIIPDAASQMTWSRDGVWTFPSGEIWVKHFDLETARGNPAVKKRIETRVLVRNASGIYGVSYRWNDAQTEATLVADGGDDFAVNITVNGSPYAQQWRIPSRAQCASCHSPQAGHALSFNTRQINLFNTINGFTGNQIELLRTAGFFSNTPESSNVLPRHLRPDETGYPVEARARSYFAVNCAYCHQAGGSGPSWDGRPELTLDQTGLINGTVGNNGGIDANKLIVPGDTTHSVVLNRLAVTNGFSRMPPIASNELDQTSIALVTDWITQSLPTRQTYADWRLAQFGSASSAAGDPAADPDGDGRTNNAEFLALTNPQLGSSFLAPQIVTNAGSILFIFSAPANRSAFVETSTDLVSWSLWDVPGNGGLSLSGGSVTITGPVLGTKQFFRLRLQEN